MEGCCVSRCPEGAMGMRSFSRVLRGASNASRRAAVTGQIGSRQLSMSNPQAVPLGVHLEPSLRISEVFASAAGEGRVVVHFALQSSSRASNAGLCSHSCLFLKGHQHSWRSSLASVAGGSRVVATAEVLEEASSSEPSNVSPPLPTKPTKSVWVRPGLTPPPATQLSDDSYRPRPSKPYSRSAASRWRDDRHFDRSREVQKQRDGEANDKPAKTVVKKKVAIWFGYVGTDFRGSMMQRNQEGPTVEAYLEEAIFKAGGMKETNFGDFKKVGWNRSSRTDKGVHALASVVSLKMEVPAEVFSHDPDGLSLADKINAHLPPSIRVYGVQPVTKSFNAYHNCRTRTYEYVLPAPVLGITDDMDETAVQEALGKLREILGKYEGRNPFHNFTVRRLYRAGKNKGSKRRVTRLTQDEESQLDLENDGDIDFLGPSTSDEATAVAKRRDLHVGSSDSDVGTSDVSDLGTDVGTSESIRGTASDELREDDSDGGSWQNVRPSSADEFFEARRLTEEQELEYEEGLDDDEGEWVERRGPTAQWLFETPPEDRIGPSHYRRILSATCSDVEPLGESSVVRIHIEGESFMLHQIRKMVGAAVAIVRGDLPFSMLDPMLACHSRVIVPMAPAGGLFLSRTRFFPFRTSFNSDFFDDGPSLELTPPLEAAREEFRKSQLLPAMAPLLDPKGEPWASWVERLNLVGPVPEEEVTQVLSAFEHWRSTQPERGSVERERPPWFQSSKRSSRPSSTRWPARGRDQAPRGGRWTRSLEGGERCKSL